MIIAEVYHTDVLLTSVSVRNNSYLGIIDETGKRVYKQKLPNDRERILEALNPYRNDIVGVVVESTYNRYRLIDLPMEAGYQAHLAIRLRLGNTRG